MCENDVAVAVREALSAEWLPTREDVRQLISEEFRLLLMNIQGEADRLGRLTSSDIESWAFQAVSEVAREVGRPFHTNEECPRRSGYSDADCACDTEEG